MTTHKQCKHEVPILGYCADEEALVEGMCEKCNNWCIFIGKWVTEKEYERIMRKM